jgi:glycosyltransferase involved in cell wall biosynthesis
MDATPRNYDTLGAAYGHFQGSPLIERVKDFVNRRALRTAIHLTTWSEWARQSLINDYGIPGGNVTVIPPGTQLDLWEPRPRPGSPGSKVRLLFVGGDFVRKGGDLLLDVFRKRLAGACTLDMVSNASVQNLPAGVRLHHGLKANSAALRSLFAEADIFVLPTRADCLPLVLMEAMAASLPIVTTDVAALGEAVRHHDNGLLVRPNDGHALNSALETLVADAALRTRMGAAGRQIAEQRFDARANGRMLLDLLRRAADRRIAERSLPS